MRKKFQKNLEKRIQDWRKGARRTVTVGLGRNYGKYTRGGRTPHLTRSGPRFTGEWPKEYESRPEALTRSTAHGLGQVQANPRTTNEIERSLRGEEELHRKGKADEFNTFGTYDFGELLERKDNTWQSRVGFFADKYSDRVKNANWESEVCNCYSFSACWAFTKNTWSDHVNECTRCEAWEQRECIVPGHDPVTKRLLLNDLSTRRHVTEKKLEKEGGRDCCLDGACTHEFVTHADYKIPWWACFSDSCEEHLAQKTKSEQLPQTPFVTIMNAQKCPCLRRGCLCNYNNAHPYQDALLSLPTNTTVIEALKQTIERLESHRKKGSDYEQDLRHGVSMIRQTKTRIGNQMTTKVKVGKETITAIVDSGADIDYVNRKWCDDMQIPYRMTGWGWVGGYKGNKEKTKLLEATIKIRVQGKFCRTRFTVLEETGDDALVLGDPWLREHNPDIDWKKRTLKWRKPNNHVGNRATQLRVVDSRKYECMEAPWVKYDKDCQTSKENTEKLTPIQEGIEGERTQVIELDPSKEVKELEANERRSHSRAYWKELNEIKAKLPDEIKEYADVFCSED